MFTLYDKIENQIGIIDNTWTFDEDTNNYLFQIKTFTNKNDTNLYTSDDSYLFELINKYTLYYNTTVYGKLDTILETMVSDLTNLISLNYLGVDNSDALKLVAERFTYDGDAKDYEVFISDKLIKITYFQDNANAYKPFKEEVILNDLDRLEDQFDKSYKMYKVLNTLRCHNNYTYTYYGDFYKIMYDYFYSMDPTEGQYYLNELNNQRDNVYYNTQRIIDQDDNLKVKELVIKGTTNGVDLTNSETLEYVYLEVDSDAYNEIGTYYDVPASWDTSGNTDFYYQKFYINYSIIDDEGNYIVDVEGNYISNTDGNFEYRDSFILTLKSDDTELLTNNSSVLWTSLVSTKKLRIDTVMNKIMVFMIDRDMEKTNIWDLVYYVVGRTTISDEDYTEDINSEDYVNLIDVISKYTKVEQDTIKDKEV